jgi:hypothetical protein
MNREAMITSLKTTFVPALRERGFKGSFPHFRRLSRERIDLLTVQFNRRGGSFIVEISQCKTDGVITHWGKYIPGEKVTAWDLHPNKRHRLGSSGKGKDGHWFSFDDGTPLDGIGRSACAYLEEADKWWEAEARTDREQS